VGIPYHTFAKNPAFTTRDINSRKTENLKEYCGYLQAGNSVILREIDGGIVTISLIID
jgi:hypothetical protein